ncbi:MAG: 3-deoxy-manno-octulosonate cytidylyltransferase [Deltaproteobacteria bacterium]|nr:3-deoxy-manno-octulosonate cytidylyltransferase [Deltaproteobacteria bacterium]
MKIVAIIPARYPSTRFPGKPLADILGKPMLQHVYERAKQAPEVARVVVATDDERIYDVVLGFGGEAVMTAAGHPSGTDRIAEAADKLSLADEDIVVNIQGDQPLFPPEIIKDLTAPLLGDKAITMSTLIYKIVRPEELTDPNHVKTVFDNHGYALYFSRATIPFFRGEGAPPDYYKHLGFYAYRKSFLTQFVTLPVGIWEASERLEQLRALEHGYRIKVVLTSHNSIEVDTPADLERVREVMLAESQ